jgi:hypothetical protein
MVSYGFPMDPMVFDDIKDHVPQYVTSPRISRGVLRGFPDKRWMTIQQMDYHG